MWQEPAGLALEVREGEDFMEDSECWFTCWQGATTLTTAVFPSRLIHCTRDVLTPAIPPHVGNGCMVCGGCGAGGWGNTGNVFILLPAPPHTHKR